VRLVFVVIHVCWGGWRHLTGNLEDLMELHLVAVGSECVPDKLLDMAPRTFHIGDEIAAARDILVAVGIHIDEVTDTDICFWMGSTMSSLGLLTVSVVVDCALVLAVMIERSFTGIWLLVN